MGSTYPLVGGDEGYFATYRQWCGPSVPSGQIGAAYSSNGTNWTTYTNLNPIGNTGPNGDGGIGRYLVHWEMLMFHFRFGMNTGTGSLILMVVDHFMLLMNLVGMGIFF